MVGRMDQTHWRWCLVQRVPTLNPMGRKGCAHWKENLWVHQTTSKKRRESCFIQSTKALIWQYLLSINTFIPVGTQWQWNSCAYDAICTVLFNIWQDDPNAMSTSWGELNNILMNSLVMDFGTHGDNTGSGAVSCSLEMIRDSLWWCLARLGAEFQFGQYASVHAIICAWVSIRSWPDGDERSGTSCEILMPGAPDNHTVQQYLDNFAIQLSRSCLECSSALY